MKLATLASVIVGLAVAAPLSAAAQPALTPLNAPAGSRAPDATSEGTKSPQTALLLSLGGTAGSVALMVAGAASNSPSGDSLMTAGLLSSLITPSLGHWYAGHYLTGGMAMRGGGGVLVIAGVAQALGAEFASDGGDGSNGDSGATMLLVGAGLYVGGTIYDIATAPAAAERWNEKHLALAPTLVSSGTHTTVGLGLGGSF